MTDRYRDTENQTIITRECFFFPVANGTLDSLSDDCPNGSSNETFWTTGIEWDDWDATLWTPEQRQFLMEPGTVSRQIYIFLGIILTLVVLFGIFANFTVLYVFSRYYYLCRSIICISYSWNLPLIFPTGDYYLNRIKRLRTTANVFIINLAICDFLSCCIFPMAIYSTFRGRWSFGFAGTGTDFLDFHSCHRFGTIMIKQNRPPLYRFPTHYRCDEALVRYINLDVVRYTACIDVVGNL